MKVKTEFISMSEDTDLKEKGIFFSNVIENCKIEYLPKGEIRKYEGGRVAKLPSKYSFLYITNIDQDYNKIILKMMSVYESLIPYFDTIEHQTSINLSFYSNDMFSLEFDEKVLYLLGKYHLSLPISCYRETYQ
jgi:hypothetical protein